MSTDPKPAKRPLPDRPNLRHLKDQAKDLLKTGEATSITDAQRKIARVYGFANWPKLKAHVESLEEIGQLKRAIRHIDILLEAGGETKYDAPAVLALLRGRPAPSTLTGRRSFFAS